ncbi:MAG: hypothetical protein EHM58_10895 [Ignavibacteriae bacterium]|nr:MAG: hypothetical protein EHM58_10895 [Ignavibacteriota bacterium]
MKNNKVNLLARLSLFLSSYIPLFILIIIKQWLSNPWHFGKATLSMMSLIIAGVIGVFIFITRVSKQTKVDGIDIEIVDVKNKNSESISYISTYIIPFLFEDFNNVFVFIAVIILLGVICMIYIHSDLLLINPILNIFYSIYDLTFYDSHKQGRKLKNGIIIANLKYLEEGDSLRVTPLGNKMYLGIYLQNK